MKMKKIVALVLFAFITSVSTFAQSNFQEVVYLKNGSIIRGVILEQIPNETIKIATADGNLFVFRMDEVEKITKEMPSAANGLKETPGKRKGYLGGTLGISIPAGDFADKSNGLAETGMQLNLVNFGYLFGENIGITAIWFGATNPIDSKGDDSWAYGGILVGPLVSFPLSEKVDWDFRPMIGYASTAVPFSGLNPKQVLSVAFNVGTLFRINVGKKVALLLNADYFSTKPEFKDFGFSQKIGTVSLGFGVAYRLK